MQVYSDVFNVLMNSDSTRQQSPDHVATCTSDAQGFVVRENDYCWGDKKIAGNAQAIVKDRWVHHTSFLWDYKREYMALLQEPERRPQYRRERKHDGFLTPLKRFGFRRRDFLECIEDSLASHGFKMNLTSATYFCASFLSKDHSVSAAHDKTSFWNCHVDLICFCWHHILWWNKHPHCADFEDVREYLEHEHLQVTRVIPYEDVMEFDKE